MVHLMLFIVYLAFIGLGLPDSVLGASWPSMYGDLGAPVSYAGIVSMIIAAGTILSSLASDRITLRLGPGRVTFLSTLLSACALLGFSAADSFWQLCILALPYGLGAGSIDAALNNYVALHYESRHMSWLHCMWGVGSIVGPYAAGFALTHGMGWGGGYRIVGVAQLVLAVVLAISLPMWRDRRRSTAGNAPAEKARPIREVVKILGARQVMLAFFCYCALEATAMLWSGSYMALHNGISAERAASLASMFFIGITAGRAVNGFLTYRFTDTQMVRTGAAIIALGCLIMLLPLGSAVTFAGLLLIGIGCAPIYPCIIHSTPIHFGEENSQALIGVQMASAYTGSCLMPPVFGLIANHISVGLMPVYILLFLGAMMVSYEILLRKTARA